MYMYNVHVHHNISAAAAAAVFFLLSRFCICPTDDLEHFSTGFARNLMILNLESAWLMFVCTFCFARFAFKHYFFALFFG